LTKEGIYDRLIVETIRNNIDPVVKGKPFERMGHKALEPNGPDGLTAVSCQKGN